MRLLLIPALAFFACTKDPGANPDARTPADSQAFDAQLIDDRAVDAQVIDSQPIDDRPVDPHLVDAPDVVSAVCSETPSCAVR